MSDQATASPRYTDVRAASREAARLARWLNGKGYRVTSRKRRGEEGTFVRSGPTIVVILENRFDRGGRIAELAEVLMTKGRAFRLKYDRGIAYFVEVQRVNGIAPVDADTAERIASELDRLGWREQRFRFDNTEIGTTDPYDIGERESAAFPQWDEDTE